MSSFNIKRGGLISEIIIEDEAFDGVKEIGKTVAKDIELVIGKMPVICEAPGKCTGESVILFATADRSELLRALEKSGKLDLSGVRGKREVYLMQIIEEPFENCAGIRQALVIAGSDKRGTIYGMFGLSERCGVSPLLYFGDVIPEKKEELTLEQSGVLISKEPSVEYRGFFINDEWPAFGSWATEKFGDVNAKAYKNIFELLLRLKGNYLWPAMWNSSFSEDGPGIENARLADMYGVVMGTSHHEPCCRAGVEWQNQYEKYGTYSTWSFISNEKAITKFWDDGLKRNKDFENVITIGMRGEADSKLLPEDATLKDNIEVIKKAIRVQDRLIAENISEDLKKVPRMLAIYKEVEDYYFGDETCEGLKDWDELEDVIFLLSDDNHGNLRALPTDETRNHAGGYGMYYHFDYHGAPISYEWTNCSRLPKIWEQMTTAYEAGVRKMWIVNVGDLKEMEYPLSYFMELAYDYEKWGVFAPNKTDEFDRLWIDKQFGDRVTPEQKVKIKQVMDGYTKWNGARTPETMNEHIYHPVNFDECDHVIAEVQYILDIAEELNRELTGEALMAYQSMIYYAAAASLNLVLAWCEAAKNHYLADLGSPKANEYADSILKRIEADKRYVDDFHKFNGGKWNHCLSSKHTGFKTWDGSEWSYPEVKRVTVDVSTSEKTMQSESAANCKQPVYPEYYCVRAEHFDFRKNADGCGFKIIKGLGRQGDAIKSMPPMKSYPELQNAPHVGYTINVENGGDYTCELHLMTRNPSYKGGRMNFALAVNDGEPFVMHSVSDHYYTEWQDPDWAHGVMDRARRVNADIRLEKGKNKIYFYAGEPGVILEKIVFYKKGTELPMSYFGPDEKLN